MDPLHDLYNIRDIVRALSYIRDKENAHFARDRYRDILENIRTASSLTAPDPHPYVDFLR